MNTCIQAAQHGHLQPVKFGFLQGCRLESFSAFDGLLLHLLWRICPQNYTSAYVLVMRLGSFVLMKDAASVVLT